MHVKTFYKLCSKKFVKDWKRVSGNGFLYMVSAKFLTNGFSKVFQKNVIPRYAALAPATVVAKVIEPTTPFEIFMTTPG